MDRIGTWTRTRSSAWLRTPCRASRRWKLCKWGPHIPATKSEHSRVAHWTFWQTWKSCKWRPTTFNNTSAEIRTSIHSFLKLSFFRRLWIPNKNEIERLTTGLCRVSNTRGNLVSEGHFPANPRFCTVSNRKHTWPLVILNYICNYLGWNFICAKFVAVVKPGINVNCVMVDWLLLIDVSLQESEIQQHYQPASGHVHRNNSLDAFVRTNRTLPNIFKSFCTTSFNQNGWSNFTFLDSCRITKSEHSRVAHWTFWQTWKSCKWRPTTFNNTSAEIRTSIHSFLKLSFFEAVCGLF